MRRIGLTLFIACAALLACAAPAFASVGVGTDVPSIVMTEPIAAGGTYELHRFAIINTGTEDMGYEVIVLDSTKAGMKVPPGWLSFEPTAFMLRAHQASEVGAVLRIPVDAAPGRYRTRLLGVPKLTATSAPGGRVTVGVGPTLIFTVVQPTVWQRVYFAFLSWMPWSAVVLAVTAAVLVGLALWAAARGRRRATPPGGEGDEGDDGADL